MVYISPKRIRRRRRRQVLCSTCLLFFFIFFLLSLRLSQSFQEALLSLLPKRYQLQDVSVVSDDLERRISFLSSYMVAFKEQTHTDIMLTPNDGGPSIPAHKSLLAARSEIFKNMLYSDDFKVPRSDTDTVTLSELNTEELNSLLEFLYTGDLPAEKFENHVYAMYVAAEKYEIRYLQELCERYMLNSLSAWNALHNLEFADSHSNKEIKETTLNFIVKNMKSIVASQRYEEFACSNPHLCVEVTRAFVDAKIQHSK